MIQIVRGDTKDLKISITQNGQPFVPTTEKIVLTVKKTYNANDPALIQKEVVNGIVKIAHEDTVNLGYGEYVFDVRIYNPDKSVVSTPIVGTLEITKVVNNDI